MLDRITFTGADDATDKEKLVELLGEFPLAEAGILLGNHEGIPRFPSRWWFDGLFELARGKTTRLSLHLCGRWVEEFLTERGSFDRMLANFSGRFKRVQLNTHGEPHLISMPVLLDNLQCCASHGTEVIFQRDGVNDDVFDWAAWVNRRSCAETLRLSTLFDLSHGTGTRPPGWPVPVQGAYCGYAGGITPDNVRACLQQVRDVVAFGEDVWCSTRGAVKYWIDAETGLMSPETGHLDLGRVRKYLQVASAFAEEGRAT